MFRRFVLVALLTMLIVACAPTEVKQEEKAVPEPTMSFVSGTEYNIGEAGQVIVEARYANGSSAIDGSCLLSVWYPDKSLFFAVNASVGANGNQYVLFTVPNVIGVYEYQAGCPFIGGRSGVVSKSFHVSEFQNDTSRKLNRVKAVTIR